MTFSGLQFAVNAPPLSGLSGMQWRWMSRSNRQAAKEIKLRLVEFDLARSHLPKSYSPNNFIVMSKIVWLWNLKLLPHKFHWTARVHRCSYPPGRVDRSIGLFECIRPSQAPIVLVISLHLCSVTYGDKRIIVSSERKFRGYRLEPDMRHHNRKEQRELEYVDVMWMWTYKRLDQKCTWKEVQWSRQSKRSLQPGTAYPCPTCAIVVQLTRKLVIENHFPHLLWKCINRKLKREAAVGTSCHVNCRVQVWMTLGYISYSCWWKYSSLE